MDTKFAYIYRLYEEQKNITARTMALCERTIV